ncbi:MAG: hypothetical protein J6S21_04400, partial [Victivallales bacterium]|nr:hypothetical protein [Victivallales bacterium]
QNIEILARRTDRDQDVWMDDAVEIILMSPDLKNRIQLVGNSIGTIYDALNGNAKHNGKYEVANLIEGIWWVSEWKLPFKELGLQAPKAGETWKMHFSRDWKNPFIFASLSDSTDFHDPATTPNWTFGDADGAASVLMDVEKIQAKKLVMNIASTGMKPAPLKASVYTLTHGNKMHTFKEVTVPAGKSLPVEYDLDRVDVTKFQNKLGFLVKRAGDGTVIQQSEYVMRSYPPMALNASLVSMLKEFQLSIDISGLAVSLDDLVLKCSFTEDGKSLLNWDIEKPAGRLITRRVKPTAWDHTKKFALTVNAVELNSGKSIMSKEYTWNIPAPEYWRNSKAGIDQTVPPPWTPVTRKGNAVSVWNRVYTIQSNGLPAAITSGGKALLSRPVQLIVNGASGKALTFGKLEYYDTQRQDEVKFRAVASDSTLTAILEGRVEFDGFTWFEVKVSPKTPGATLNKVQLAYAMPESEINYANLNREGTAYVELFLPEKIPTSFGFCPSILMGNDARALEFYTETDRNYFPEHQDKCISIRKSGAERVVTVDMVTAPKKLNGETVYAFGWQAAPVKRIPDGWRGWIQHYNGRHNKKSNLFHHWSWSRWYGFLRPIDAKEMHDMYGKWKDIYPDMIIQPYFCQYILSMISEEYKL